MGVPLLATLHYAEYFSIISLGGENKLVRSWFFYRKKPINSLMYTDSDKKNQNIGDINYVTLQEWSAILSKYHNILFTVDNKS